MLSSCCNAHVIRLLFYVRITLAALLFKSERLPIADFVSPLLVLWIVSYLTALYQPQRLINVKLLYNNHIQRTQKEMIVQTLSVQSTRDIILEVLLKATTNLRKVSLTVEGQSEEVPNTAQQLNDQKQLIQFALPLFIEAKH